MDEKEWQKAKDACFCRAVRKFFFHAFKDVHDPEIRLSRSIKAAGRPIRDENLVLTWRATRRRKPKKDTDEEI
jgi:hypothetical protein